jgi:nucleotide-binding universal stress UspA family protein
MQLRAWKEVAVNEPRTIQVVVAFDFTPSSEHALERAIDVAVRAPRHLLHVVTVGTHGRATVGSTYGDVYESSADRLHRAVHDRVVEALVERMAPDIEFHVHARIGKPEPEILGLAEDIGADLIFIGSHGRVGLERFLLGSVSERVVREARCPVMVVRPKSYKDVVLAKTVPYDHERHAHSLPHRYSYSDRIATQRSKDWPLGGS